MSETVKAKTFWVWTDKAEAKNPARSRSGEPIWEDKRYEAPQWMIDQGLIQDAGDVDKEGQMSIFDLMG
ncbi:hypothetical protein [Paenibacillus antarcticus]|uniref:Uncharacterized protein n=1 Tax=Paenibacillus antarcticus TaxID=253703 RepID=A0A162QH07_9BACL|nr:hypothetical protein [Paenibacillus antarcticus]OAB48480.1 hypothetical protein PBAT_02275 [Paenibacillus antarcticus]